MSKRPCGYCTNALALGPLQLFKHRWWRCIKRCLLGTWFPLCEGECVSLDPKSLERLLGRFQTYLPSLWTLLVAEYSSVGVETLCMLLDSLLALLHVDSMEAVQVWLLPACTGWLLCTCPCRGFKGHSWLEQFHLLP